MTSMASVLAVDPVPWARSQMAFTLGFHIILVPLGVSWAFMTLIANYRGVEARRRRRPAAGAALVEVHGRDVRGRRRDRHGAHLRVRPAVADVHGALRAPRSASRSPFEGLFFFTEAIFVAIYIYGWRRLKPWAHFWTGVPVVIAGIGGSVSVVAANAWMNEPSGLHARLVREGRRRRPVAVIFNKAMPLRGGPHGGGRVPRRRLPHRVRLRGRACCAAGATATTASGSSSRSRSPRSPTPVQMARRRHAGPLGLQQRAGQVRRHRARAADGERRARDPARPPELERHGRAAASRSPGWRRGSRIRRPARPPSCRASTPFPADERADRRREVNVVHLAWDVMVGLGTLLFLLSRLVRPLAGCSADEPAEDRVVPAHRRASPACVAVITMEAGWVVTEVGRQPWIVYNYMRVERRGDDQRRRVGHVPR